MQQEAGERLPVGERTVLFTSASALLCTCTTVAGGPADI